MKRNVFLYWIGKEYSLIKIFKKLLYAHSKNGTNYNIIFITPNNIDKYAKIPDFFYKLLPAHQADYIRVNAIYNHGGIWLDSDVLVMNSLDDLFKIFETYDGFFFTGSSNSIGNGVFGSKKNTNALLKWKNEIDKILNNKKQNISWTEIGSSILTPLYANKDLANYKILNIRETIGPANSTICIEEYINKPYDNYKNLLRDFQPIIIFANCMYKNLEGKSEEEILKANMPLNYFINKSLENIGMTIDDLLNFNFNEPQKGGRPSKYYKKYIKYKNKYLQLKSF